MRDIVTVAVSLSLLDLVTLKDAWENPETSGKSSASSVPVVELLKKPIKKF